MATIFWNSFSGKWDDGASWLGGVAPGKGDTAVVAHGTLTNGSADLSGLTIQGQTIEVIAANQLTFGFTTLDAATSLSSFDADGLVMAFTGPNTFNGTTLLAAPTSMYLIPGMTSLVANYGTATISAATQVLGFGAIVNGGTINVGAPNAGASFTIIGASAAVQNDGLIAVTGAASRPVSETTASFAAVTGSGMITAAHAEVSFNGAVSGGMFQFADNSAVLQLNIDTATFGAVITKFGPGNRIDLGTTAVDSVAYVPDEGGFTGTLNISNAGTLVAALAMDGTYSTGSFVMSDIGGDLSLSAPCFAQGTRLSTVDGEVAVEALRPGDVMRTRLGGASARVVWTGWRRVDCRRHARPQDVMPVRVRRGAFAEGVPARDVVLSPDHAVFDDGVLVPVRYLVNGVTIVQQSVAEVTYWHVELERHDVMEAAGLAVESYLDTGNRGSFANGPEPRMLHADFARAVWAEQGCAPLFVEGPEVVGLRARLLARAMALGAARTRAVEAVVSVDGQVVVPLVEGRSWLIPLPLGARRLRLRSPAGVPAQVDAADIDARHLGVAIAAPAFDGVPAGLDDRRFRGGWHAAEADWRWTDGDAVLDVSGLSDVAFMVLRAAEHWRKAG